MAGEIHKVIQVELAAVGEAMGRVSRVSTCDGDANGGLPRPLVVLQANPHRRAYESKPRVALVDHCVPVAEAIATDMAIHNGVWRATMTRQAPCFRSAPETIGQALPDMGAYKCVAGIAGKDGGGSIHSERPYLVTIWGKGQASTGDDFTSGSVLLSVPGPIGLALQQPLTLQEVARTTAEENLSSIFIQ